jgi:hypothetical protein
VWRGASMPISAQTIYSKMALRRSSLLLPLIPCAACGVPHKSRCYFHLRFSNELVENVEGNLRGSNCMARDRRKRPTGEVYFGVALAPRFFWRDSFSTRKSARTSSRFGRGPPGGVTQ